MSITFYPHTSNASADGDGHHAPVYGPAVPVFDHLRLYEECQQSGIPTDWWFPYANHIRMVAGHDPSEAYLLLSKRYIDGATSQYNVRDHLPSADIAAIKRDMYSHKITIIDNNNTIPLDIKGWVFHSARAIDGGADPNDLNTIYLVKFVDRRYLFARQPGMGTISGDLYEVNRTGFNIVDPFADLTGMDMTPVDTAEFPYVSSTVNGTDPWSFEEILQGLWRSSSFLAESGATMSFLDYSLPTGGDYPAAIPLDIRLENRPTWDVFCDLLHATGNEIFPKFDGTFSIKPIDDHFLDANTLETDELKPFLIEQGHINPEDKRIPEGMTMTFQLREMWITDDTIPEVNHYTTPLKVFPTTPSAPYPAHPGSDQLLSADDYTASKSTRADGMFQVSEFVPGVVEDVTTFATTWVPAAAANTDYTGLVEAFAFDVLQKLIRSRADVNWDVTYGKFVYLEPCPENEEVSFYLSANGACTRFRSLDSVVGVSSLPYIAQWGGMPKNADRKAAADPTDDTPATILEKMVWTQAEGYWDANPGTLQEVWFELETHGSDPDKNNLLKAYTTLGTGAEGPAGPAGPPGADGADGPTYTDGCGIIVADTVISFDPTDAVGKGLQVDPYATTACSMAVKPSDLVGCGLEVCSDNVANQTVKIKVKPADLAGCGLKVEEGAQDDTNGPCKLAVDVDAIAGCGLKASTDNIKAGIDGCKLVLDVEAIISSEHGIDKEDGDQSDDNGPCRIKVKTNKTIRCLDPDNPPTLTLSGGHLTLTWYYKDYDIYGVDNGSGNGTTSVDTTECSS